MPVTGRPLFWSRTVPMKSTVAPLLSRSTSASKDSTSITFSTIALRTSAPCDRRNDCDLVARSEHDVRPCVRLVDRNQRERRQHGSAGHRAHVRDHIANCRTVRHRYLNALALQHICIGGKEKRGHSHS